MLIIVVIVFILCWTPILIFEVLQSFDIIGTQLFGCLKHIKTFLCLLSYMNRYLKTSTPVLNLIRCSCLNPLIYGFMSRNFRKSFTDVLFSCHWCHFEKDKTLVYFNNPITSIHNLIFQINPQKRRSEMVSMLVCNL